MQLLDYAKYAIYNAVLMFIAMYYLGSNKVLNQNLMLKIAGASGILMLARMYTQFEILGMQK